MSEAADRSGYSIAAVSKLTGVSCHALRVWERRYGYPSPHRTASGHRRYGPDEVEQICLLARSVQAGHPVGEAVLALRAGGLVAVERVAEIPSVVPDEPEAARLVDRLMVGDLDGADELFRQSADRLGPVELIARVIEPALIDTGERWFRGDAQVFQERCASGFLRRKLGTLLDDARRANCRPARTALIGTMSGDRHEGGVLILGLLLELAGWRARLLGVDLPFGEYQLAIEAWRPDLLCISFVMSRDINKRFRELGRIGGLPIVVGGRSILNYQGLARRSGLIPLSGPAHQVLDRLIALAGRAAP